MVDRPPDATETVPEASSGAAGGAPPAGRPLWERTLDRLIDALALVSGGLLAGLTLLTAAATLSRYFFNRPLGWSIELTEYALLYVTFLGAPWVLRQGGHVRIDIVTSRLNPSLSRIVDIFSTGTALLVTGFLVYFGARAVLTAYSGGLVMIKVLRMPRHLILAAIPIGSLVLMLQLVRMLLKPTARGS